MYIMTYRKYAQSKLATVISFIGMFIRYGGVFFLIEEKEVWPTFLICIVVGIGFHFLAELVAKQKSNKVPARSSASAEVPAVVQEQTDSTYRYIPPKGTAREVIYEQDKSPDNESVNRTKVQNGRNYCNNCGAQLKEVMRFCPKCGVAVGTVSKDVQIGHGTGVQKKRTMRTIAWVLLALNAFSILGGLSNGSIQDMLYGGSSGAVMLVGYFSPAIIAVILFIVDGKRNKN